MLTLLNSAWVGITCIGKPLFCFFYCVWSLFWCFFLFNLPYFMEVWIWICVLWGRWDCQFVGIPVFFALNHSSVSKKSVAKFITLFHLWLWGMWIEWTGLEVYLCFRKKMIMTKIQSNLKWDVPPVDSGQILVNDVSRFVILLEFLFALPWTILLEVYNIVHLCYYMIRQIP